LVQLQKGLKKLEDAGIQVVAISYDSVEVLQKFAEEKHITYPLLSDSESKTITAYGILNKEATGKAAGIPYPGTFVIDKEGVVRAKLFREGYAKRHTADELVEVVKNAK
jgi:peroxiredoxin